MKLSFGIVATPKISPAPLAHPIEIPTPQMTPSLHWPVLKDTATVRLTVGESTVNFTAGPGLTMSSVSFSTQDQQTPYVSVSRNSTKVVDGNGGRPINTTACDYYECDLLLSGDFA